jgi:penicillin amidase
MNQPFHAAIALGLAIALAACGSSSPVSGGAGGNGSAPTPADQLALEAENVLPPGQSGFWSLAGEAAGTASGNPADFGAHVDDQRALYWSFGAKPGALGGKPGAPASPLAGVQVYRDSYGVPIVYAGNVHDLYYGVGYAVAQDRLFLMDAVRRMGEGRMGELTGCGAIPADIQQRVLTYSDDEYNAFFDNLSQDAKDAVQGYVDGANAWLAVVQSDPTKLPAEYGLLTTTPAAFTVKDVLAAGVYITRFVAAEGGNEFQNIRMIQLLQQQYGSLDEGLKAFRDLVWLEDPQAVTTIPRGDGTFSNQLDAPGGRDAVLGQMAQWAVNLPQTIWKGEGTGDAATPQPCALLSSVPLPLRAPGAGGRSISMGKALLHKAQSLRAAVQGVVGALEYLRRHLHGGSHAYALGPSRTRDHGTLLLSGPQLGYSYPTLLVEYEIHGGGYDARGVSVPLLPVVGIGYSNDIAWGLTTGYSKTIDSFVETICSTAQQAAGSCKANQYLHNGAWQDMSCRSETFNYRAAAEGIPAGPAILNVSEQICRTVHGPVVARDDTAGLARSVQYAMFQHEIDTIEGIRLWNKAHSFADFLAGAKLVTWNENVTVATRDGHIAYFHPGLFPQRPGGSDMRLPSPGTGQYDLGANLPFDSLPHDIDPPQGYLANWNTKPAYGWLDGEGLGDTSRPGGPGQRVTTITDLLSTRSDWSFADLAAIDQHVGSTDHRARSYLPLIQSFRGSAANHLDDTEKAALDLIIGWDHNTFSTGNDSPAATVFGAYVTALRDQLFAPLKTLVIDSTAGETIYSRESGVGSHVFDMSAMDNLVLRVLDPGTSGLGLNRDWTGGRDRDTVMQAALDAALQTLGVASPADLPKASRAHPLSQICSLSGVVGPGSDTLPGQSCVTMPYEDRGSWVHRTGYEKPSP